MRYPILLLSAAAALFAADAANMSGQWVLSVERSRWNGKPAPQSVTLTVEHLEPKLKYAGKVVDAKEGESTFAFDGAIDGKEYTMQEGGGQRKAIATRLSPAAARVVYKSMDGKTEEIATTQMSRDGRTLERRVELRTPAGRKRWTEIYEKR